MPCLQKLFYFHLPCEPLVDDQGSVDTTPPPPFAKDSKGLKAEDGALLFPQGLVEGGGACCIVVVVATFRPSRSFSPAAWAWG